MKHNSQCSNSVIRLCNRLTKNNKRTERECVLATRQLSRQTMPVSAADIDKALVKARVPDTVGPMRCRFQARYERWIAHLADSVFLWHSLRSTDSVFFPWGWHFLAKGYRDLHGLHGTRWRSYWHGLHGTRWRRYCSVRVSICLSVCVSVGHACLPVCLFVVVYFTCLPRYGPFCVTLLLSPPCLSLFLSV